MWTRTFEDGTIERFEAPGIKSEYHPLTSVKWPRGGWIVWNWRTHSWDDKSDNKRAELKRNGH